MTFIEMLQNLSTINLQTLSDDDIKKLRAILNIRLSEIDWIIRSRQQHRAHFSSEKKQADNS